MSPIEHVAEQIAACMPIIGMTSDVIPPAYIKVMVGITIAAMITLGGGYVAGAVSAERSRVEFGWIKSGLEDAKQERKDNAKAIASVSKELNNFKGEVHKEWGGHK